MIGLTITLSSCGTSSEATGASPSPSSTQTTSLPSHATEKQVASVISEHVPDWKKVVEDSTNCRVLNVSGKSTLEEAQLLACYTSEVTAGMTAQTAIRKLDALSIPPELTELVGSTKRVLQGIANVKLEAACGPSMTRPKDTETCSNALGTLALHYRSLESELNRWQPYL